ncbi:MAG: hypothetical protein ABSC90_12935 [Acidimicrobiales bacterium]|jgi:hypothetical protein
MTLGRDLAAVVGALLIIIAGWSVIGTVVVPRRIRSRLTRAVAVTVDASFHFVADHFDSYEPRDRLLAAQAPIQLILQIVVWLAVFELGFALLLWPDMGTAGLSGAFQLAGSSLCTLGYLAPHHGAPAGLVDLAALIGLGTVALQIGYLPTLYAAFNRREGLVTMLDSRAGVPSWGPELLARTHYGLGSGVSAMGELPEWFEAWERWSADVSESHATYLALLNFRSPRPLSSWLIAQLAVLDAAALYLSLVPDAPGAVSARLCLRGGFTCLGTIARARGFAIPAEADPNEGITLTYEEFVEAIDRLASVDFPLERSNEEAWLDFVGWRVNYEAAAYAIARAVDAPPALWSGPRRHPIPAIVPRRPATRRADHPPRKGPTAGPR